MTLPGLRRRALAAAVLLVLPVAVTAQVVFHGVGDLPGGPVQSDVRHAIRVGGVLVAVGGSAVSPQSPGSDASFLWTSTDGMIALPNLAPNLSGTNAIVASAITPDGRYIASRARVNPFQRHAVRVTRDGLTNLELGALPGNPQHSHATGISNDGSILYGFARYNDAGNTQAVRYTAAGPTITAIPFPRAGDNISSPVGRGTSADGSVMVGTSTNSVIDGSDVYGPGNGAFRYVHGAGVSLIPLLPEGSWSVALALSADGNLDLAVSDTPQSPFGEAYIHNAQSGTLTSLGTPAAGWRFSKPGGMTADATVIAATLGEDDAQTAGFIRNTAGWHSVEAIIAGAGVDLSGWTALGVAGVSADGTLLWGSGTHNGHTEGWLAEFPAGYLAAYSGTQPLATIVGAWGGGDAHTATVFLNDGHYFHIEEASPVDAPDGVDGFERGTYTWNVATKVFTATTLQDTNGSIGLSALNGLPGMTIDGTADLLTARFPGTGRPEDLVASLARISGTSPIVGAWFAGNAALPDRSGVIVFRDDGTYFMAQDGDSSAATGDPNGRDGMEYGTYTWNPATGAFSATAIVDTNGEWGFSHPKGTTTISVAGDLLTFTDSADVAAVAARVKYIPLVPVAKPNYQGVWWNAPPGSEGGWGINFAHQGDTLFATWFTYGADGKPLWSIALLEKTEKGVYSGVVSTVTGPPYDAVPFDSSKVVETVVGTMTVTFAGGDSATMAYTVNGVSRIKTIVRQIFASPVPTCVWAAQPNLALAANLQDVWWNYPAGSESGWGINFAHQGDIIFATWFTYGANGKPLWFIVVAEKTGAKTYVGPVSTVTGPPFFAVPFDPALVVETVVGSASFTFADGNRATFDYTVNGTSQSKQITRQVFNPPGTACY